jgi:hypothetical protein
MPAIPDDYILDDAETTRGLLRVRSRAVHYAGMQRGEFSRPVRAGVWSRKNTLADIAKLIKAAAPVKRRRRR